MKKLSFYYVVRCFIKYFSSYMLVDIYRLCMGIFFKDIKVVGQQNVPKVKYLYQYTC